MKSQLAKDYHADVAGLRCVLCTALNLAQTSPTNVHHLRSGKGKGQRAGHFTVAALCHECHQGPHGFHGDKTLLRIAKVDELDLLDMTIEALRRKG